jgi:hypothetical protein
MFAYVAAALAFVAGVLVGFAGAAHIITTTCPRCGYRDDAENGR